MGNLQEAVVVHCFFDQMQQFQFRVSFVRSPDGFCGKIICNSLVFKDDWKTSIS
jgi:hypothetical protein